MGLKIAILGTASSWKDAPFDNKEWEIWALGNIYASMPRFNRFFELHQEKRLLNEHPHFLNSLNNMKGALWARDTNLFKEATPFPIEEIIEHFKGSYFTSSIAWMLGLAIMQDPEEIGLWGVHMQGDNEYAHQRPCCEYLIGMAKQKGIKITIHPDSCLLKGEPYCESVYYDILGLAQKAKEEANAARDEANYRVGYSDALEMLKRSFG